MDCDMNLSNLFYTNQHRCSACLFSFISSSFTFIKAETPVCHEERPKSRAETARRVILNLDHLYLFPCSRVSLVFPSPSAYIRVLWAIMIFTCLISVCGRVKDACSKDVLGDQRSLHMLKSKRLVHLAEGRIQRCRTQGS